MRPTPAWLALLGLILGAVPAGAQDLPRPRKKPTPPTASPAKGRRGEPGQAMEPVRFPVVPFRPPAPPVLDPRTGAWQQVRSSPDDNFCPGPVVVSDWVCQSAAPRPGLPQRLVHQGGKVGTPASPPPPSLVGEWQDEVLQPPGLPGVPVAGPPRAVWQPQPPPAN
jgi:hypothetical protein